MCSPTWKRYGTRYSTYVSSSASLAGVWCVMVHKVANVMNEFPKFMQPTVKVDLREIWRADTRAAAETAMDTFAEIHGTKHVKAVTFLTKDKEALLTFCAFPTDHWDHLRTGSPKACSPPSAIESCGPWGRCHRRPRSYWSSSSFRPSRKHDAA